MGQIISMSISFLWRCLRPKSNETPRNKDEQPKQVSPPLESHNITIYDHEHVIVSEDVVVVETSSANLAPETPHILLDLGHIKEPTYGNHGDRVLQVVQENVREQEVVAKTRAKLNAAPKEPLKKIGPYYSSHKILLVGEGNFSFSTSLAVAFGSDASNIIATSLNAEEFLKKNYRKFVGNKIEMESRGATVIHGVDATKLLEYSLLGSLTFDRIIFNFPHTGNFGRGESEIRKQKKLVRGFLRNARELIKQDGQIHITHKSNGFFREWDIPKIGSDQGLQLIQASKFERSKYPGYETKYGFGGDKNFHCNPSKTYKFGLRMFNDISN